MSFLIMAAIPEGKDLGNQVLERRPAVSFELSHRELAFSPWWTITSSPAVQDRSLMKKMFMLSFLQFFKFKFKKLPQLKPVHSTQDTKSSVGFEGQQNFDHGSLCHVYPEAELKTRAKAI